jgi:hypothetical protein
MADDSERMRMSDTDWAFETEEAIWVCSGHVTLAELERRIAESMGLTVSEQRKWTDMDDISNSDVEHRWAIVTQDPELYVRWGDVTQNMSDAQPITLLGWLTTND